MVDVEIADDHRHWTLRSGKVRVKHACAALPPDTEPDPSTPQGREILNQVASRMLTHNDRRRPHQPALGAFLLLESPAGVQYVLPTLQYILEQDLEISDYTVDRISWPACHDEPKQRRPGACWALRSGQVCVENDHEELGLTTPRNEEPNPDTPEGRAVLNQVTSHMLILYGEYAERVICESERRDERGRPIVYDRPALGAFMVLQSPGGVQYVLPTLQYMLEQELELKDYTIDRISWPDAMLKSK